MQLHSFLSSVVVVLFWINGRGECSLQIENSQESEQFTTYKQCIQKHSVPTWLLLGPAYNQSFYTSQNRRFNLLFERVYPIAIIMPTEIKHVQVAVRCGVDAGIPLVPISGGHSNAGLSYGSNSSIVIDFQYMNSVTVNREKQYVTVEPGALQAKVYGTLWRNGKLGAPLGVCATVGIGGLALSGGAGFFTGLYGLVIDNILEMNMVDASGNAVLVDPNNNVDLWWALRGVGPGYIGLITSFKIRAFETEDLKLTHVHMKYDNRNFATVMESYLKWLDWTKENEPSISSLIILTKDGISAQMLQVTHRKINSTGNPAFPDVLLSIFPEPIDNIVTHPTFSEFVLMNNMTVLTPDQQQNIPEDEQDRFDFLATITKDKAAGTYFSTKSFYVKKRFNAEQLMEAQKIVMEITDDNGIWINSELELNSDKEPHDSAFVHRNLLFYIKIGLLGDNVDNVKPGKEWVNKLYESIKFLDSGETYQGYTERGLTNYLSRYYGSNTERLIEIKRKWDPKGYFNVEQSIPSYPARV